MSKQKTLDDIPMEEIKKVAENFDEVKIRVTRRNEKGQLQTLYNGVVMQPSDLAEIDSWLMENCGGGKFRIEVKDPEQQTVYVMPPFHVYVEGRPRRRKILGNPEGVGPRRRPRSGGHPGYPGAYVDFPEFEDGLPAAWEAGLPPHMQPRFVSRGGGRFAAPPGATMASDQLAMKQAEETKAQVAKLTAEFKALQAKHEEETTRLRDELAAERAERAAATHRGEMAALKAEISALAKIREQPVAQPQNNMVETIAAITAAMAPVMSTMVQARHDSQSKSLQLQQESMKSFMKATLEQGNKASSVESLLTTLGPIIMPMITSLMEQKSPMAQAALFEAVANNNLNQVSMMAQLIEVMLASGGEEQAKWVPVFREMMGGLTEVAGAYLTGQGGLPGQGEAMMGPPQPAGFMSAPRPDPVPAPSVDMGGGYATLDEEPQTPEVLDATDGDVVHGRVDPATRALFALLPTHFRTQEWQIILERLHMTPLPKAEQVAGPLAAHLEHMIDFSTLPPQLQHIESHPRESLEALLEKLPVATKQPAFASEVLDLTLQHMVEDGYLVAKDQLEDAEIVDGPPDEPEVRASA